MSYHIELEETLPESIQRMTQEQLSKAQKSLVMAVDDPDEAVHDVRKCFKKIRAILRLVRDGIGENYYRRENASFRDAGRLLAPVRDSTVALETLVALRTHFADQVMSGVFESLEQHLRERQHQAFHQVIAQEHTLDTIASGIEHGRSRVSEWADTLADDFSALEDGVKRVYKRGHKAMARAYASPTPENFHEWRKRVKYLWYHSRILHPLWPAVLGGLRDTLHQLADYLGDAHDLANLHALLASYEDFCQDQIAREMLLALVQERRQILHAAARLPGERIFVEKPKYFSTRIDAYWTVAQEYAGASPLTLITNYK
jgi:CHAD domain-containing protein